jgi:hypothetical protein
MLRYSYISKTPLNTQSPQPSERTPSVPATSKLGPAVNAPAPINAPAPAWVLITPDMAREWLRDLNTHNRRLNMSHVESLTRDMAAGKWEPNNNAIAFGIDEEGREVLLDGQHRLAAISRAGVAVPMMVARGLPMSAQGAMDIGRHRTYKDALHLADEKNSSTIAAVLRRIALWEAGSYRSSNAALKPTRAEMDTVLEKYPELRKDADWARGRASSMQLAPTVATFVRWLLRETNESAGVWFTDRLYDLHELPREHVIQVLHKRIVREREMRAYGPDDYVALIIKAWNYYRRNEEVGKIQMPGILTNETFPRPVA